MRHRNHSGRLSRDSAHREATLKNLCKNLIQHERIETTVPKAKELRRYAEKLITLAKNDTLHSRRQVKAKLSLRHNVLTTKEAREVKSGDTSAYNTDRTILKKLFSELGPRFANRQGGYTRIVRLAKVQAGDAAEKCIIEYLAD